MRSKENNNNKVVNGPQSTFQKWMVEVEYSTRGGAYGRIEYVFRTVEVTYVVAERNS